MHFKRQKSVYESIEIGIPRFYRPHREEFVIFLFEFFKLVFLCFAVEIFLRRRYILRNILFVVGYGKHLRKRITFAASHRNFG